MSSLLFKRIRICSESEQAAMELEFHRHKTLLWGPNGVGKSAVLKSAFRAFDAEPEGVLPGWDYQAIVAVDFTANGRSLTAVRRDDLRALFEGDKLLGATTTSLDWNGLFAETVGFKLHLVDRDGTFRHAAPANYFLPFFINQDGSFEKEWATFESLKQFMSPILSTMEYFARIRPLRHFELKADEHNDKRKEADLKVELQTLQRTRVRVKKNLKTIPVKLTEREFQAEVRELTARLAELSTAQDQLRRSIVEDQDAMDSLHLQIRLSEAALKEHAADFKFAAEVSDAEHRFVCPTCHAVHDDSFHTFLGLAEDARELSVLKGRLQLMLESTRLRLERNRRKAVSLKANYAELQSLLATKRGRFSFEDFLNSRSAFAADEQLATEERQVATELEDRARSLRDIKAELKEVAKDHDSEGALEVFREHFKRAIVELDTNKPEGIDKWRIDKRPYTSGSRRPRAIIAYYTALWRTIEQDSALPAPVVIDSPNQGAQDRPHLQRLLTTLAVTAPADAQVILAHEEDTEEFKADHVIEFKYGQRILTRDKFARIAPRMLRYVERARATLAGIEPADGQPVIAGDGAVEAAEKPQAVLDFGADAADRQLVDMIFVCSDSIEAEAVEEYLRLIARVSAGVAVEGLEVSPSLGAFKTGKIITFVLSFSEGLAAGDIAAALEATLDAARSSDLVIDGEPMDDATMADRAKLEEFIRAHARRAGDANAAAT